MGNLPTERSWVQGFRLAATPKPRRWAPPPVVDLPKAPAPAPAPAPAVSRGWNKGDGGFFLGPFQYVNVPNRSYGPLWDKHNHDPALAIAPGSGDLVAVWFTTYIEPGREAALATATLRAGETVWGNTTSLYDPPDRCMCCPAMIADDKTGELILFSQQSPQAMYGNGIVLRHVSADGGKSWRVQPVESMDFSALRHQPVETLIRLQNGMLLLPTDNGSSPSGTALHFSTDNGKTFVDPGGNIAGLHGAVAQLNNGSLLAFGRGHDGPCPQAPAFSCMAQSRSDSLGRSWAYSVSELPGVHPGQRETLMRLREGPLMMTGYANTKHDGEVYPPLLVTTASGKQRPVLGLYAALSHDEGETWGHRKLISDNSPDGRAVQAMDGEPYTMNKSQSEPNGYTATKQGPDGTIHVITSRNHFAFSLAWLMEPSPDL
jgi:hypothetical protein